MNTFFWKIKKNLYQSAAQHPEQLTENIRNSGLIRLRLLRFSIKRGLPLGWDEHFEGSSKRFKSVSLQASPFDFRNRLLRTLTFRHNHTFELRARHSKSKKVIILIFKIVIDWIQSAVDVQEQLMLQLSFRKLRWNNNKQIIYRVGDVH